MNKLGTVRFSGRSGNQHKFTAYPLETVLDEAFSGVYVVTRRRQRKARKGFGHKGICTGRSDASRRCPGGGEPSLSAQGANCICVHAERSETARQTIEQDLAPHPPADNA